VQGQVGITGTRSNDARRLRSRRHPVFGNGNDYVGVTMTHFEKIVSDLSDVHDNTPDYATAHITFQAIMFIHWQSRIIEELKSEIATLEAIGRSR
jgi:hypothetical protein